MSYMSRQLLPYYDRVRHPLVLLSLTYPYESVTSDPVTNFCQCGKGGNGPLGTSHLLEKPQSLERGVTVLP